MSGAHDAGAANYSRHLASLEHLSRGELQLLLSSRRLDTAGPDQALLARLQDHVCAAQGQWVAQPVIGDAPAAQLSAAFVRDDELYLLTSHPLQVLRLDLALGEFVAVSEPDSAENSGISGVRPVFACCEGNGLYFFDRLDMSTYRFSFATGEWDGVPHLGYPPTAGVRPIGVAYHSGGFLLYGGLMSQGEADPPNTCADPHTVWTLDFSRLTWGEMLTSGEAPPDQKEVWSGVDQAGEVPAGRSGPSLTVMGGFWIMHGGAKLPGVNSTDLGFSATHETYAFHFATSHWTRLQTQGSELQPRMQHCAAVLLDSVVFVGGASSMLTHPAHGSSVVTVEALQLQIAAADEDNSQVANPGSLDALRQLYNNELHSDLTVRANGLSIAAHKAVLAAQSPVFEAMFGSGMAEEATGEVIMSDIQPQVVQALIKYLYGQLDAIHADMVIDLFKAAAQYNIPHLQDDCLQLMLQRHAIDIDNAASFAKLADDFNLPELLEAAINFAAQPENSPGVARSPALLSLMISNPQLAQQFVLGLVTHTPKERWRDLGSLDR